MPQRLAFIGLGVMGEPMAGHLLRGGHALAVHTRSKARAQTVLGNGAKWAASQTSALHVPAPTWGSDVTDARVLGSTTVNGRPAWIVSFATPSVPAWFTAWIDKRSSRPLRLRMTAPGHFMFHRYVGFDRPLRIVPPR